MDDRALSRLHTEVVVIDGEPHEGAPPVRRRTLDEFPQRMLIKDVAEWLGISVKRAYALEKLGDFMFAEHRPSIGRKKSWSRDRFKEWDRGTLTGLTPAKHLRRIS